MRWLTKSELIFIHLRVIQETGGDTGILNESAIEACLLRPFATFEGHELYPDLLDKVAALITWYHHRPPFRRWEQARGFGCSGCVPAHKWQAYSSVE